MQCPECQTEMQIMTNTGQQATYACMGCSLKWTRDLLTPQPRFNLPKHASLRDLVATAYANNATEIEKIAPEASHITVEIGRRTP